MTPLMECGKYRYRLKEYLHKFLHYYKFLNYLKTFFSPRHQNNATLSKITPLLKTRILPQNNIPLPKSYAVFHVHHVQSLKDQINYLYAAHFNPEISTFLAAINLNYFATFPNLTTKLVKNT